MAVSTTATPMPLKHFTSTTDFTKEEYLEIVRRAAIFRQGGDFTHLARGKIMAVMMFQESTRTVAVFQAAIIRLGGGWLGIPSPAGSYVAAGEESVEDTLLAVQPLCDVMAVRHKNFDLAAYAKQSKVPVVNAMCGGDEHSVSGLWLISYLASRFPSLDGLKVGVYGMVKSSRPAKAYLSALSLFDVTVYEDPVILEFESPAYLRQRIQQRGVQRTVSPVDDFLGQVDFLNVVEGLPQAGEDEKLVEKYNQKFQIFGKQHLSKMRPTALVVHGEPTMMTDGRSIVVKEEIHGDPHIINQAFLEDAIYTNMALITYQLGIKV